MNKLVGGLCAAAMFLVAGETRAGVGVSPPGKIFVAAQFTDASFQLSQDIIGPEKPSGGIIGPDRPVTTLTRLQVCYPPDPGSQCTPKNVQIKVSAADAVSAQAGGMLVAVGQLAGIIGPEVQAILAKSLGLHISAVSVKGDSVAGIIGPDVAADLLTTSLSATVPRGECVISGPPVPCPQHLPGMIIDGAAALGLGTMCGH